MSDQGAEDIGYRVLTCDVANCGARFSLRERLSEHYQVAHSRIMCEYDDCLQHYANRWIAKEHFNVHTDARHSCQSCGKFYLQRGSFHKHKASCVGGRDCEYRIVPHAAAIALKREIETAHASSLVLSNSNLYRNYVANPHDTSAQSSLSRSGGSSMWNPTFGGAPSSSVGGSFFSEPPSRLLTPDVTKSVSKNRSKGVQCTLLSENLRVMYNRGTQVSKYCCCILVYLVLY